MNEHTEQFKRNRFRYQSDPEFAAAIDSMTELSTAKVTAADVPLDLDAQLLLMVAHEYWLHGEVHLYPEDGKVHILPPERIADHDPHCGCGRGTLLLITPEEAAAAEDVDVEEIAKGLDLQLVISLGQDVVSIRRTSDEDFAPGQFLEDLRR